MISKLSEGCKGMCMHLKSLDLNLKFSGTESFLLSFTSPVRDRDAYVKLDMRIQGENIYVIFG